MMIERLSEKMWGELAERLARLLDGGVPLLEALLFLGKRGPLNQRERAVFIAQTLQSGHSLSQILTESRAPLMMLTLVEVGEQNGDLAGSLFRAASYCRERVKWRQERRQAAAYPLLVGLILLAVTGFLLGNVVPRFADLYAGMGLEVAGGTQMLFWSSKQAPFLFLGSLISGGGCWLWLRHPRVRSVMHGYVERLPVIRQWYRLDRSHEWAAGLGLLLDGGLPLIEALEVQAALPMRESNKQLCADVRDLVLRGRLPGGALEDQGLDEELVLAVQVAEATGDLSRTLLLAEKDLGERRKQFMDVWIKALEPILLGLCGLLVGGVALMLLWPMLDLLHRI